MNWVRAAGLFALAAVLGSNAARAAAPLTIYDDQLRNGFADWSWATHSLTQTTVVHSGTAAISFLPSGDGGLYLHTDAGLYTGTYDAIEFWVYGSGSGHQAVSFRFLAGLNVTGSAAALDGFVTGGAIPAGAWAKVRVPFASLGLDTATTVNGFWLQDSTGGTQTTIYVDDVVATAWATPPPPPPPGQLVTVAVDPSQDRRAISPLVFGVNFGSAAQAARLRWPLRRWGGNSTTRYSWQDDISNKAMDWFFYNIEDDNPNPAALPDGSAADRFVDETRAGGGDALITVPLIGWTPIDRVRRWGFSVAKYGPQAETECTSTGGAFWCQPDAGNGVKPGGGSYVTGNDPHDTSREIGTPFVTGWMAHLSGRTGNSSHGGVRFFALDNEPMLWNSTHRDVHPQATTYDELWQKTQVMAAAMKAKDPGAKTFGPALWGWCAYFYSAADGCQPGADMAAHGNQPFLAWYLAQAAQYEAQHGVRLVDYADVHHYPQASGVALPGDEGASASALRLRSLKSLYDPSYTDESWIAQPIRLIPRLRDWIAANYPGTKIAITEYSWGEDNGPSSALAHAEALSIFGREGVDAATRWVAPDDGTRVEDSFLLHLNYDGAGATALGESVRAVSSNVDAVGAYAVAKASGRLVLLLYNKDTVVRPVTATIAGASGVPSAPVRLFEFDGTQRLHAAGAASALAGVLSLDLPSRSATLAEISLPAQAAGAGLWPVTPCRVLDTRLAAGPRGGPALAAGATRPFVVAGTCGIPYDARSVVYNLTVASPGAAGSLAILPGDAAPGAVRTLSFGAGRTRASCGTVGLSTDGTGTVSITNASSAAADAILDVAGYFR